MIFTHTHSELYYLFQNKYPSEKVEVPVDANIKYKKEVTCIKWKNIPEAKVIVQCSDGASYTADHAIVTVSLGVLKDRAQSLFSPALPPQKLNALKVR
jgi:monoamine oxidase